MEVAANVATPANRPLSVRVSSTESSTADDPMSPVGRVMEEMGYLHRPRDGSRHAREPARLPRRHPNRTTSVPALPQHKPHWVQTTVNLDDHIILPRLDPAVSASDPDKAVEDYVSSLSTLPMDRSRPLWEFHFLDFATSEATSTTVLRLHHSIGDGMSIMTLLMASSRSTADRARLPAMPPLPRRTGAIYQQRTRPPLSSIGDYLAWIWSYFVLVWHTLVDIALLNATLLFLRDPRTMFTRVPDKVKSPRRKRLVHRSLNLDDVKLMKTAMNCTINDVLVGVTSAALSKYYFRKSGDAKTKRIHLRSILPVNIRPLSSRQTYVTKVETGNQVSILICPFHIALHDDPLEYVHKATRSINRKKSSLEVKYAHVASNFFVEYFGAKIGAFFLRRFSTRTSILVSNVVGPAEHITLCGHPITCMAMSIFGQPG
ncbi:unnamed protein product [Triticum aestivum]|uniref:Uncharacterized protein n=1 Tax=Triticum aestivum TaxID=4565 RepID=A0A7H4LA05_WHEAT|nr:unnamed protein product [Triticum aestivum]